MRRILAAAALALSVSACATAPQPSLKDFPNQRRQYDVRLAWKAERAAEGVKISGVLRNDRYVAISGVELTASLRDAEKKQLATKTFLFAGDVRLDEESPFQLDIPLPSPEAAKSVEFTYRYRIRGEKIPVPIFHSFEEPLGGSE
ncbi:MAG TPA: hypothetical protein VNX25_01915 [Verrucomicrobiae bacterium]|nr:hypothetical protein [Verrucomicrobiae bacterium]